MAARLRLRAAPLRRSLWLHGCAFGQQCCAVRCGRTVAPSGSTVAQFVVAAWLRLRAAPLRRFLWPHGCGFGQRGRAFGKPAAGGGRLHACMHTCTYIMRACGCVCISYTSLVCSSTRWAYRHCSSMRWAYCILMVPRCICLARLRDGRIGIARPCDGRIVY